MTVRQQSTAATDTKNALFTLYWLFSSLPSTRLLQPRPFNLFISLFTARKKQNQYCGRATWRSTKPFSALREHTGLEGTQWAHSGTQNLSFACFQDLGLFCFVIYIFFTMGETQKHTNAYAESQYKVRGKAVPVSSWGPQHKKDVELLEDQRSWR